MIENTAARAGAGRPTGIAARIAEGWRDGVDPAWLEGGNPVTFELPGGTTEVVAMGEGETLVLIPPLPGYKEAWVACARLLARSFRVVSYDLRVRFDGSRRWDAMLDDLDRITAAFAPGPLALVGHSLGGAVAQQWTLAHPDRVRALVLSSSFLKVRNPIDNWYARFVEQPLLIASQRLLPERAGLGVSRIMSRHGRWVYDTRCDDRLLGLVRFCMRTCDTPTVRAMLGLAFAHDMRARAGEIRCPTLVIVGERESSFYGPAAGELVEAIPGACFERSPGVSHLHPLSSPEWLAGTITRWLRPSGRSTAS